MGGVPSTSKLYTPTDKGCRSDCSARYLKTVRIFVFHHRLILKLNVDKKMFTPTRRTEYKFLVDGKEKRTIEKYMNRVE